MKKIIKYIILLLLVQSCSQFDNPYKVILGEIVNPISSDSTKFISNEKDIFMISDSDILDSTKFIFVYKDDTSKLLYDKFNLYRIEECNRYGGGSAIIYLTNKLKNISIQVSDYSNTKANFKVNDNIILIYKGDILKDNQKIKNG